MEETASFKLEDKETSTFWLDWEHIQLLIG